MLYLLYLLASFLALNLPSPLRYFIAFRIADLFYFFSPTRRKIVYKNLSWITGKVGREVLRMSREVYYNFARTVADFLYLPRLSSSNLHRWIQSKRWEYLEEAFSQGKGVVCLTAHLGNWEWGGAFLAHRGKPIKAIVLPQKNKWVNRIFTRNRTGSGMEVIPVGLGIKKSFEALRKGYGVAILGDRLFNAEGVKVKFLGREVYFPRGPVLLAYHTGALILPGFTLWEKNGKYCLYLEKAWEIEKGDKESVVRKETQKIASLIEKYVRKYPTQWMIFEKIGEG